MTDPNTIPDEVADAAHREFWAFANPEVALSKRQLGISRQAWKCAIAAALDKMKEIN